MIVHLSVVRFEQKPGLCGAATAQMILHYKNRIGNQPANQDTLWAAIQSSTGGARPVPPAKIGEHDCPKWTTQQCDQCEGAEQFRCWCTFPPALLSVLLAHNLPFALVVEPPASVAATASVIASVDFDIPAAALVKFGLHWIVVAGYETDGINAVMVNGRAISEIYIRDPEVGAANHTVPIETWHDEYVSPVIQCGVYLSRLVVISATGPAPLPPQGTVPSPPTNLRIRPKVPVKRKRPPRRPPINPRAIVPKKRSRRR